MAKGLVPCAARRAFTLTEIAILLFVAGSVLGGVWVAASAVWDNYRVGKTVLLVQETVRNVRDYYGPLGQIKTFASINAFMSEMDDSNHRIFPSELRWDPSGGFPGVMVTPLSSNVAAASPLPQHGTLLAERITGLSFRVSLLELDQAACQKLLMAFPLLMPEMGVARVFTPNHTGGIAIDLSNIANPGSPVGIVPFTPSTAATECSSASTKKEIRYDFKLFS